LTGSLRSTEIEDKKVDKNGLGHLGLMAKKGQMAIYVDIAMSTLLPSFFVSTLNSPL
jgi:hypothetical protein